MNSSSLEPIDLYKVNGLPRRSGLFYTTTGTPLAPIYRLLFAQRGTMEIALGVIVGEKTQVKVLKQTEQNGIIRRNSIITGAYSGRRLLYAESRIETSILPKEFNRLVRRKRTGIGKIITATKLETYIGVEKIGTERNTGHPFRSYRIYHNYKPALRIRETILI